MYLSLSDHKGSKERLWVGGRLGRAIKHRWSTLISTAGGRQPTAKACIFATNKAMGLGRGHSATTTREDEYIPSLTRVHIVDDDLTGACAVDLVAGTEMNEATIARETGGM